MSPSVCRTVRGSMVQWLPVQASDSETRVEDWLSHSLCDSQALASLSRQREPCSSPRVIVGVNKECLAQHPFPKDGGYCDCCDCHYFTIGPGNRGQTRDKDLIRQRSGSPSALSCSKWSRLWWSWRGGTTVLWTAAWWSSSLMAVR